MNPAATTSPAPLEVAAPDGPYRIRSYEPADAGAVVDLVLHIQTAEFGLPIGAADQPDLLDVPGHYLRTGGGFWLASDGARVVGSVGLLDIGAGHGVLRKMFVAATHRGRPPGLARALLHTALRGCRDRAMHTLWLGTTEAFGAARRFYAREGFEPVDPAALPATFPRMAVDTHFFRRATPASPEAAC